MQSRGWGLVLFVIGILFTLVYSIGSFLWGLIGVPLPYLPIPDKIWGFLLPIGVVLMVLSGLVYGRKSKEVIK